MKFLKKGFYKLYKKLNNKMNIHTLAHKFNYATSAVRMSKCREMNN